MSNANKLEISVLTLHLSSTGSSHSGSADILYSLTKLISLMSLQHVKLN